MRKVLLYIVAIIIAVSIIVIASHIVGPVTALRPLAAQTPSPPSRPSATPTPTPTSMPISTPELPSTPTSLPASSRFVQVCGTQLCLNGQPYRIHGATAYSQYANATNEIALAKQARLNTLEIVEYENKYHDINETMSEATWKNIDNFIAEAGKNDIHVILALSSYGHSLKTAGKHQIDFDLWKPFFDFITSRVNTKTGIQYINDPTISMIEIFGEIDPSPYDASFFQKALAYLRTKDPNHILSTGGLSYINYNSGIDWRTIMSDPSNQVCGVEINSDGDRNISVPNVSDFCKQQGKPWFLAAWSSCFGRGDYNHRGNDDDMAKHAQDMYDIEKGNSPAAMPAVGSDFWNLGNIGSQRYGSCDIGTQFPATLSVVQNNA
jgi:hypothetical protein